MKRALILFVLFISTISLFSQHYPGTQWQTFETEHYKFIFPAEMRSEALRVAQISESTYYMQNENLHPKNFTKYPIILTADSSIANGYVSPLPKSSVWYPIPIAEGVGTTEWYTTLSLHEGRHIHQFNTLDQGLNRFLYYAGGGSYSTFGLGFTPFWLIEGDAVVTETLYSDSGRGRDPLFQSQMLAMAREDQQFNYYKMLLGSYRHNIPNQYEFGYFFTSWLQKEYGTEVINEIFTNHAKVPLPLIGSSVAAKRSTGHTFAQLYKLFIDDIKLYADSIEVIPHPLQVTQESDENRLYTNYKHLFNLEDKLYVVGSDMVQSNFIEPITSSSKLNISISINSRISSNSDILVWDELVTSPRYPMRSHSEIIIRDANSIMNRRLTNKSRYFSPALSDDGNQIVVIEKATDRTNSIIILDSSNGEITYSFELESGIDAFWPVWNRNDSIVFIAQSQEGKKLFSIDMTSNELTSLTPWMSADIKRPIIYNSWILFSSTIGLTEEIYAVSNDGILKQMTSSLYGSSNPIIEESLNKLYFIQKIGTVGDIVASIDLDFDKALTLDLAILETTSGGYFEDISGEYDNVNEIDFSINPEYEKSIEDYSVFMNSTKIVSWGIIPFIDTDFTAIPLLLLYSNDLLNSMEWELSLRYDTINRGFLGQYDAIIKAIYPLIQVNLTFADRPLTDTRKMDTSLTMTLPFGHSRGNKDYSVDISTSIFYSGSQSKSSSAASSLVSMNYGLNLLYYESGGYRSLQPKWLWQSMANFSHTLDSNLDYRLTVGLSANTPGFYHTHGFSFEGWYEQGDSIFGSSIPMLNGYRATNSSRERFTIPVSVEQKIMTGAAYSLPLFYPDLPLGGLLYIKRVNLKLFYETEYLFASDDMLNSLGCELTTDFAALNFDKYDFNMGVRYSLLFEDGNYKSAVHFVIQQVSY